MVDFQYGFFHVQTFDSFFQLPIEDPARRVECLVVDSDRQHEVAEQQLRHLTPPGHLTARAETCPHISQVEVLAVVGDVGQRHVGIEEHHGLGFFLIP